MLLQPDAKIVIAGSFTSYDGTPINKVARLNSTGVLDSSFNPGGGTDSLVFAAALQPDGKVIIVGLQTFYDGISSNGITRVNGDFFVTWPAGDLSNKTVTLPIVDDAQAEPSETLTLTLNPLTIGATTGANPNATLTIVDNDAAPTTVSAVSGSATFGGIATLTATLTSLGNPRREPVFFSLNGSPLASG